MSENSILKAYRSPTELKIQWMRIMKFTEKEILDSIQNGEVKSLEVEQSNFNEAMKVFANEAVQKLQVKFNKTCDEIIDYLVFYG